MRFDITLMLMLVNRLSHALENEISETWGLKLKQKLFIKECAGTETDC